MLTKATLWQCEGKTIAKLDSNDSGVIIAFTDGTYVALRARICGYHGDEMAEIEEFDVSHPYYGEYRGLAVKAGVWTNEEEIAQRKAANAQTEAAARKARRAQYEQLRREFE